ncbi:hypothetical protein CENSYa_0370 [Cenarchaeum symbiosum A]|uniref:Uncharacterized protein n=1 Tax=Cenarchaeum symbiosum (strain A) TaxID=414004 RepID=A0RUI9_CENSY|nr:hypothetical protein CENSYa_0370 [Cenarchaeum symbiosum A]
MNPAAKMGIYGASVGLAAVLALTLAVPAGHSSHGPVAYGMAEAIHMDAGGSVLMSQTVHNLVVDQGEEQLIDRLFKTAETRIEAIHRINILCLTDSTVPVTDSVTAASMDPATGFALRNGACAVFGEVEDDETDDRSLAVMGPVNFTAGSNFNENRTVTALLVCPNPDDDEGSCRFSANYIFAAVPLGNLTFSENDTLQVTYTFDVSSDNN